MSDRPPGWQANPSTWLGRAPEFGLALVGLPIALYLAAYQFGLVAHVWDPFFGSGSERVLTSKVSQAFPVPDAFLGALGYLADIVTGLIGGEARWRTHPWAVLLFGATVLGMAAAGVVLIVAQPLLVGTWCTLCLASAVISLSMVVPALDEVLATLQHLGRERARGASLWRAVAGQPA